MIGKTKIAPILLSQMIEDKLFSIVCATYFSLMEPSSTCKMHFKVTCPNFKDLIPPE